MNIVFRTDASSDIGSGHVMRCLTLANLLSNRGANVSFICREINGHLCDFIEEKGFNVFRLNNSNINNTSIEQITSHSDLLTVNWNIDAEDTIKMLEKINSVDWLIVDHYSLEKQWEIKIKSYVNKLMVIDDLADRNHFCDVLIDQNNYKNIHKSYENLVNKDCLQLLGTKCACFRPEFLEAKKKLKIQDGSINNILIFYGGSDKANLTVKTMKAIKLLNVKNTTIDVVVGKSNVNKKEIKELCERWESFTYYCQVENLSQLMLNADLALGAGGSTSWERCFLGLPSITIILANNQIKLTESLEKHGAIINLGWYADIEIETIMASIKDLLQNPIKLKEMSRKALSLMPSMLNFPQIYHIMKTIRIVRSNYELRPINRKDLSIILEWRNSERIRRNMYNDSIITLEEHIKWYENLKLSNAAYFVFEYKKQPIGIIYFNNYDERNNKCSWGFYIGDEKAPKGIGKIMGFLGLVIAFEKLNIHKVSGECFSFNEKSVYFHKKLGFTEEGKFKQHFQKDGVYHDIIFFSLLQDEWFINKKQIESEIFLKKP